jgi:hypothetical protein
VIRSAITVSDRYRWPSYSNPSSRRGRYGCVRATAAPSHGARKSGSHQDGDRLTFDVRVLEGDLAGADGLASVFVDIIGLPFTPLSFAGVARRTARRAYWYGAAPVPRRSVLINSDARLNGGQHEERLWTATVTVHQIASRVPGQVRGECSMEDPVNGHERLGDLVMLVFTLGHVHGVSVPILTSPTIPSLARRLVVPSRGQWLAFGLRP